MKTVALIRTATLAVAGLLATSAGAAPKPKLKVAHLTKSSGPVAWCAEEFETLPNGLCHIDGGQKDGKRTLVVFLHGAIARDVEWQWLQERALARQAKASHFEAVFARAPLGPGGYLWPGTAAAQATSEEELIEGWKEARTYLENKNGKYDEVFLMGFSSGAYFVSSLALRGRTSFDGFAVFAGGAGGQAAPNVEAKAPVYVGVCANDSQTANHSRGFGGALAARGWPSKVDEQPVGHMFSDVHMAHALAYLRGANRRK